MKMPDYNHETDRPIAVKIRGGILWVTLADGRIIGNPLEWFTWLASATPEQQANYKLWPFTIDWPDLDEGLDIEPLLLGNWTRTMPVPKYVKSLLATKINDE